MFTAFVLGLVLGPIAIAYGKYKFRQRYERK